MRKSPETTRPEGIPRPKLGRLGMFGRRIKDIATVTALSLMHVLGGAGCERDDNIDPQTGIERCFDPEYRERYPFQQNIFVALAIHIVMNSDGTSDINIDSIKENIDDIRRVYADIILDFYVHRVKYVQDSTLQPGSIPGETRGEYEERLKAYIEQYGTENAVDLIYTPGGFGVNGSYIPSEGGEFIVLYTGNDGRTVIKKTVPHELAHLLGLKHPFNDDGLDDTINYYTDCPGASFITYMDGDDCIVACSDGTLALPANLMDEYVCRVGAGQIIQTEEELTNDQLEVSNCVLQSVKDNYINPGLPETEF